MRFHGIAGRREPARALCLRAIACCRFPATREDHAVSRVSRTKLVSQHLPAQFLEVDTRGARGHRHQAVVGHAGHGIDLEQQRPATVVGHEIRASPAFGAHCIEGCEREAREMRLGLCRHACGTVVLRIVAVVLGFVVIEGVRRFDADRRQHAPVQYRHGVFSAGDPLLREHRVVDRGSRAIRRLHLFACGDLRHADAGTLRRRLHDQRQAEAFESRRAVGDLAQYHRVRRRDTECRREALGAQLVHAQCRTHHAAAGVRQADHLERALCAAVLATRAMQCDEGAVVALCRQLRE